MTDASSPQSERRGLMASMGANVVLLLLTCALLLYVFMLNIDLGDIKRRLSKEVEARQLSERYLVETRNQLTESLREIELLNMQRVHRDTDSRPVGSAVPVALPVVVGFHPLARGQGLAAVIENTSDRHLTIVLTVRNPLLPTARRFKLELEPGSRIDFGDQDGWPFTSGDEMGLFSEGFAAFRLTVP